MKLPIEIIENIILKTFNKKLANDLQLNRVVSLLNKMHHIVLKDIYRIGGIGFVYDIWSENDYTLNLSDILIDEWGDIYYIKSIEIPGPDIIHTSAVVTKDKGVYITIKPTPKEVSGFAIGSYLESYNKCMIVSKLLI